MFSKRISMLIVLLALVMLVAPAAGLVLIGLNLFLSLIVLTLRLAVSALPLKRIQPKKRNDIKEPFVSVHVPAHNEPPVLLNATLKALSELDYSNYEVIVIDNNTVNQEVWKPVEKYCKTLGKRFRFIHVENLSGFKSGALNYIRPLINKETEYIAIVDADYRVAPSFLKEAVRHFDSSEVGLVQFPQAYQNVVKGNRGVAVDYDHFFSVYMNMANYFGCVPSTGTVSVLNRRALEEIGEFSKECITEDAEIGFRLTRAGYRGVYVHKVVGEGMMPHDVAAFKAQRRRWSYGNAQIFFRHAGEIFFGPAFTFKQRMGFFIQLSAWASFTLLPAIALTTFGLKGLFSPLTSLEQVTLWYSAFTVFSNLVLQFVTFIFGFTQTKLSFRQILNAFGSHVGMSWVTATAWVEALLNRNFPFIRTNKFLSPSPRFPSIFRHAASELTLSLLLFLGALVLMMSDQVLLGVCAMLTAVSFLLVVFVYHQMGITKQATERLVRRIERQLN